MAVQGACLTVTAFEKGTFSVDVSHETLKWTNFGGMRGGERVHLERALRLADRLGGHLVQGHVDAVAQVLSTSRTGDVYELWIGAPTKAIAEMIDKGSITVDGVSLTINEVRDDRFRLTIVPHTAEKTLLGSYRAGDKVHIETDVIAKYVRRMLERPIEKTQGDSGTSLAALLESNGFFNK